MEERQELDLDALVGAGALKVIKRILEEYIEVFTDHNGTYSGEWSRLFDYFLLVKLLEKHGRVKIEEVPKKVAIVHSDDSVIKTLDLMVRRIGYQTISMKVDRTTTTQQVAEFVERADPVIVFLAEHYTYQEPPSQQITRTRQSAELDALEVLRIMNPTLPIYMVSAIPLHINRAKELGVNGYVIYQHPVQIKQFIPPLRYPTR